MKAGLGGGDIWRGRGSVEVSCAELSAFGVEDVERSGFEVTGVEERGARGRLSDGCGVLRDAMRPALGVYVPKDLRIQLCLPTTGIFMWNISVSFGICGFDANGGFRMIGRQYPNSPSMAMPAVVSSE